MHRLRQFAVVLTLVYLTRGGEGAFAQGSIRVADIEAAWGKRARAVKGMRVEWTETQFLPRGLTSTIWGFDPPRLKHLNPAGKVIPPKDTSLRFTSSLSIESEKIRFTNAIPTWNWSKSQYDLPPSVVVFDGEATNYVLTQQSGRGESKYRVGYVLPPRRFFDPAIPQVWAILVTFRGLSSVIRPIQFSDFDLTSRRLLIQKRPCVELSCRVPPGDLVRRLWVDPERDYVMVRYTASTAERVFQQVDIDYRPDSVAGYVPESWKILTAVGKTRLQQTYTARVEHYEINPSFKRAEFNLQFPPGTEVYDEKRKRKYVIPGKVDGDGFLSANDKYPSAAATTASQRWSWLLVVGAFLLSVLVVAGLALRWLRRHRRTRTSPNPS